ncbi:MULTISPECIES: hypothetical protein [Butyricimonas]|nr:MULTISPECIES: hypothetical protein [Butyricimonas]
MEYLMTYLLTERHDLSETRLKYSPESSDVLSGLSCYPRVGDGPGEILP